MDYRPRSSGEVRDRLRRWGFSDEVIGEVIDYLELKGSIDDELFKRVFVQEMLDKGFGCRRVRNELKKKKFDTVAVNEVMVSYPFHREAERAREAAEVRIGRMEGSDQLAKAVKIKRYLMRLGYTAEVAGDVCRSVVIDTQTEPE